MRPELGLPYFLCFVFAVHSPYLNSRLRLARYSGISIITRRPLNSIEAYVSFTSELTSNRYDRLLKMFSHGCNFINVD